MSRRTMAGALLALLLTSAAFAQAPSCEIEAADATDPQAQTQTVARSFARERLASYHALLPAEPDSALLMPVAGVRVAHVADTWGAARDGGRFHEGQDIFAPIGTPVYAATNGYVYRIETRDRGGRVVWVAGAGGRRYYYAHLDDWAEIEEGMPVTTDTILGYVGNTGNAAMTPPHLHFGIYSGSRRTCDRQVYDPLPLLVDR